MKKRSITPPQRCQAMVSDILHFLDLVVDSGCLLMKPGETMSRSMIDTMSNFMRKNFADILEQKGFSPYQNNMRQWYKVVGDSIILTVILDYKKARKYLPELYYGFIPLYVPMYGFLPFSHSADINKYLEQYLYSACLDYFLMHDQALDYFGDINPYYSEDSENERKRADSYGKVFDEVIWPMLDKIYDFRSANEMWQKHHMLTHGAPKPTSSFLTGTREVFETVYSRDESCIKGCILPYIASRTADMTDILECSEMSFLRNQWPKNAFIAEYEQLCRLKRGIAASDWADIELMFKEIQNEQTKYLIEKKIIII